MTILRPSWDTFVIVLLSGPVYLIRASSSQLLILVHTQWNEIVQQELLTLSNHLISPTFFFSFKKKTFFNKIQKAHSIYKYWRYVYLIWIIVVISLRFASLIRIVLAFFFRMSTSVVRKKDNIIRYNNLVHKLHNFWHQEVLFNSSLWFVHYYKTCTNRCSFVDLK